MIWATVSWMGGEPVWGMPSSCDRATPGLEKERRRPRRRIARGTPGPPQSDAPGGRLDPVMKLLPRVTYERILLPLLESDLPTSLPTAGEEEAGRGRDRNRFSRQASGPSRSR
jgi:hypothetical protein